MKVPVILKCSNFEVDGVNALEASVFTKVYGSCLGVGGTSGPLDPGANLFAQVPAIAVTEIGFAVSSTTVLQQHAEPMPEPWL